jgi:glycosyltransferase involved in cell wall biosynthesis
MYKFTIIVTDYDQWVDRERAKRGIQSLENQTFRDFEVLIMHDGPRTRDPVSDLGLDQLSFDFDLINTEVRHNLWGHPQRNLGIQMANGEYIIHFNIDNYLEPSALEILNHYFSIGCSDGIVFPIRQHVGKETSILRGYPPVHCGIDCLQLCASTYAWRSIGGWHRYEESSDGWLYMELYAKFNIEPISEILGDNYISARF